MRNRLNLVLVLVISFRLFLIFEENFHYAIEVSNSRSILMRAKRT